jgi:hypothetical protein
MLSIFEKKQRMSKDKNIVHQYFKKEIEGGKILVKVNPIHYTGIELIVDSAGKSEQRALEFDEQIFDDLAHDGFVEVNPLEFNIYFSGLI